MKALRNCLIMFLFSRKRTELIDSLREMFSNIETFYKDNYHDRVAWNFLAVMLNSSPKQARIIFNETLTLMELCIWQLAWEKRTLSFLRGYRALNDFYKYEKILALYTEKMNEAIEYKPCFVHRSTSNYIE